MKNIPDKLKIEEQDLNNKKEVLGRIKNQGLNIPSEMQLNETPKMTFDNMSSQNEALMANQKEHIQLGGANITRKVRNKVKLDNKKEK